MFPLRRASLHTRRCFILRTRRTRDSLPFDVVSHPWSRPLLYPRQGRLHALIKMKALTSYTTDRVLGLEPRVHFIL